MVAKNTVTTIIELFISELKPQCLNSNEYIMAMLRIMHSNRIPCIATD